MIVGRYHQVVNLTNGYTWGYITYSFTILATGKRMCSSQNTALGCSILAAGKRAYPAKIRPSTVILIVDIDRNLSKK